MPPLGGSEAVRSGFAGNLGPYYSAMKVPGLWADGKGASSADGSLIVATSIDVNALGPGAPGRGGAAEESEGTDVSLSALPERYASLPPYR